MKGNTMKLHFVSAWILTVLVATSGMAGCSANDPGQAQGKNIEKPVEVEVERPTRRDVVRNLEGIATLEPWEEVTLYAKTSGYLHSILVDRGDWVKKGSLLATLDIPEMNKEDQQLEAQERQARASLEQAKADLHLQETTVNRLVAIQKEEFRAITQQEVDLAQAKLEAAQASLSAAEARLGVLKADRDRLRTLMDYARITAPFAGLITDRFVDPGALVTAGTQSKPTPLVKLVNTSKLRAIVDVPETDYRFVKPENKARLSVDAYPDQTFEGTISRFSGVLDPKSRTMRTEVLIPNEGGVLTAGMFGRITLDLEIHKDVLTVAANWVRMQKDKACVFVANGERIKRIEIQLGADDGNVIEVRSGLTGDEDVITSAIGALSDGSLIVRRPSVAKQGQR